MTKYEGQQYRPRGETPGFFSEFLEHYRHVVRFLTNFNENRLQFEADVRNQRLDVTLAHGKRNTFRHNLGYIPSQIVIEGRVEGWVVSTRSADTVVLTPKLLTTPLTTPVLGKIVLQVSVMDPTLFVIGDRVNLGGESRTIREIQGNLITLDASVYCDNVYVLSLAVETAKVTLY